MRSLRIMTQPSLNMLLSILSFVYDISRTSLGKFFGEIIIKYDLKL